VEVLSVHLVDAILAGSPGSTGELEGAGEDANLLGGDPLDWERDGTVLVKHWRGKDFAESLAFVNRVAELAEAADHHPDIAISWNQVTLRLWTHSAGGLTSKDIELARQIDGLSQR
jgi:4a-hydroxytetrahydrobiopterin dehydratase